MRSGWKAFWYNTSANVFSISLKDEYRPAVVNEDYLIEDILQRAYIDDTLEYQAPKLVFDFNAILQNRKGKIDVSRYKKMFAKLRKKRKRKNNKKK